MHLTLFSIRSEAMLVIRPMLNRVLELIVPYPIIRTAAAFRRRKLGNGLPKEACSPRAKGHTGWITGACQVIRLTSLRIFSL